MNFPPGWKLPDAIAERLGESSGRQRAIVEEGHLLLVLHKLPEAEGARREGIFFWRQPEGEWHCSNGKGGIGALRGHLESFLQKLGGLDDDYERAQSAKEYFAVLESVVPIHRAAKNQFAALQSAREALPEVRELITLRDLSGDVERAADLLHSDAKNALDFKVAQQAEEQARLGHELSESGHRLNLLAALFLPLSVIGGAFGSTLRSGFEGQGPWLFWTLLGVALLVGFWLRGARR